MTSITLDHYASGYILTGSGAVYFTVTASGTVGGTGVAVSSDLAVANIVNFGLISTAHGAASDDGIEAYGSCNVFNEAGGQIAGYVGVQIDGAGEVNNYGTVSSIAGPGGGPSTIRPQSSCPAAVSSAMGPRA